MSELSLLTTLAEKDLVSFSVARRDVTKKNSGKLVQRASGKPTWKRKKEKKTE